MLMKKISLLLVGVLALFSCEQEGLDNIMEISDVEQVKTRTAGSIAWYTCKYLECGKYKT